jgi:hypothetical protein
MTFANIPDELLNLELGEAYDETKGWYRWTLRSELEDVGEDILNAKWKWESTAAAPLRLVYFTAYTKSYILTLVDGIFTDQYILKVPINPEQEP